MNSEIKASLREMIEESLFNYVNDKQREMTAEDIYEYADASGWIEFDCSEIEDHIYEDMEAEIEELVNNVVESYLKGDLF